MADVGLALSMQNAGKSPFRTRNHANETLAGFFAMALVDASEGIKIGGTYTIAGGSSATITKENIVDVLFDSARKGKAYWINNLTATKGKPDRKKLANAVGLQPVAENTKIVDVQFTVMLKESMNTAFENYLGDNPEDDVFLFTSNTFIHIPYGENAIVYSAIGTAMDDINTSILTKGGFEFMYRSYKGEIAIEEGLGYTATLASSYPKYNVTLGTLTNCTNTGVSGKYTKILRTTTNTANSVVLTIANYTPTNWYVLDGDTDKVYVGTNFTFNTTTGVLTVASATPAGKYPIKVIAESNTGVKGEFWLEFTVI